MEMNSAIYISYDGLLEPLGRSQIVPYLKGLSADGIRYLVLSFEKGDDLAKKKDILLLEEELRSFGIEWVRLRYHKNPAAISTLIDIVFGSLIAFYHIKKKGIKVVHARSYVAALIAIFLQRLCRVRFIFDMRGFWADERIEAGIWKRDGRMYPLIKYFEKKYLLKCDEVVSLTEASKREIEQFPYLKNRAKRITVIPTCVDLGRFRRINAAMAPADKDIKGKPVLIYIGSLSTWYMPKEMFEFFEVLQGMMDEAHFLILTKDEDFLRDNLQKERANVSILSVGHTVVPQYLSIADIGVAFYKPGFSRKGCCPTKFGEYLAAGLPIVINAGIGDCDEIISKERVGVIINGFSSSEYEKGAVGLKRLLSEGDELRQRCSSVAERYLSLAMGVERYRNVYKRLDK